MRCSTHQDSSGVRSVSHLPFLIYCSIPFHILQNYRYVTGTGTFFSLPVVYVSFVPVVCSLFLFTTFHDYSCKPRCSLLLPHIPSLNSDPCLHLDVFYRYLVDFDGYCWFIPYTTRSVALRFRTVILIHCVLHDSAILFYATLLFLFDYDTTIPTFTDTTLCILPFSRYHCDSTIRLLDFCSAFCCSHRSLIPVLGHSFVYFICCSITLQFVTFSDGAFYHLFHTTILHCFVRCCFGDTFVQCLIFIIPVIRYSPPSRYRLPIHGDTGTHLHTVIHTICYHLRLILPHYRSTVYSHLPVMLRYLTTTYYITTVVLWWPTVPVFILFGVCYSVSLLFILPVPIHLVLLFRSFYSIRYLHFYNSLFIVVPHSTFCVTNHFHSTTLTILRHSMPYNYHSILHSVTPVDSSCRSTLYCVEISGVFFSTFIVHSTLHSGRLHLFPFPISTISYVCSLF